MPKVSLVVCLYKERDLLERLLQHLEGCYDDLIVVHDGPEDTPSTPTSLKDVSVPSHLWPELAVDYSIPEEAMKAAHFWKEKSGTPKPGSIHELAARYGGRFFEGPKCWQQEPHWPLAWWAAQQDWILRLDADEFPSPELKKWLVEFRSAPASSADGFTCYWPPWDGLREVSGTFVPGRLFLFNKNRVSFFGMVEHTPVPSVMWIPVELILHHRPSRKSYGPGNLIFRKQGYVWRRVIALSLLKSPLELPHWRLSSAKWPPYWENIRKHPLKEAFKRSLLSIPQEYMHLKRSGRTFLLDAAIGTALHKLLIPVAFWYYKLLNQIRNIRFS